MRLFVLYLEAQQAEVGANIRLFREIGDARRWAVEFVPWRDEGSLTPLGALDGGDAVIVLAAPGAGAELGTLWDGVKGRADQGVVLVLTRPSAECRDRCPGAHAVGISQGRESDKAALLRLLKNYDPSSKGVFPDDSPTPEDQLKRRAVAVSLIRVLGEAWAIRRHVRKYSELVFTADLGYAVMALFGTLLVACCDSRYLLVYLPGLLVGQMVLWERRKRRQGDDTFKAMFATTAALFALSLLYFFVPWVLNEINPGLVLFERTIAFLDLHERAKTRVMIVVLVLVSILILMITRHRVRSSPIGADDDCPKMRGKEYSWVSPLMPFIGLLFSILVCVGAAGYIGDHAQDSLFESLQSIAEYLLLLTLPLLFALRWVVVDCDKEKGNAEAYVINLHGAWGSGKSSIMRMIVERFRDEQDIVVLEYNAWKETSKQPVWWTLPEEFYRQAMRERGMSWVKKASLSLTRQFWMMTRVRGHYWSAVIIAFLVGMLFWVAFRWSGDLLSFVSGADLGFSNGAIQFMATLVGGIGTLATFSIRFANGGGDPSQAFTNQSDDPMDEIKEYFKRKRQRIRLLDGRSLPAQPSFTFQGSSASIFSTVSASPIRSSTRLK